MNIYNRDGLFAPYMPGGLGVVNTDSNGSDSDDLQGQLGVGVLTRLMGQRLRLRSEVLARGQDASDSLTDMLVNVGFSVALGSKAAPASLRPVAAAAVVAAAVAAAAAAAAGRQRRRRRGGCQRPVPGHAEGRPGRDRRAAPAT